MNASLKHWREAATLILAAGRRLGADSLPSGTPLTAAPGPPLGSSHGRSHLPHSSCFDYDVLMLKRSSKSGFMPNAYVFPGGVVDSSDFSSEWLDIFKSFRSSPGFGLRSVTQPPETRPPVFATDRLKLGSPIPGDVAFRICALRETFEETGVLLVVSKPDEESLLKSIEDRCATAQAPHRDVNELHGSELTRWRALVNQDPSNFLRMCRELEVLPNIWALHEWANWLTPAERYGATRFDTAFFVCCLQETPHNTVQDEREIVGFQWSTPSEILQSYQAQELWIAPPQFYELSRMCRLPSLNDLHDFARWRATEGCERWLPVYFLKEEHYIVLLPGDKLYQSNTSGKTQVDTSTDPQPEDPQGDTALHRMVILNPYSAKLQITITPKYNHLHPVVEPALSRDSRSQL
ncbi:nucleoside diphosphate-linked moiety X motif 19 [Xiphias gladius]|uniref:nucleoside diphosphate-linked moiety X motif 19 n=1 Tax=Xiphias gladius TaxID=8245 RepID=UPI001A98D9D2|nr:nucleoside diphosphate-linked moiety X motif 19 [Xiphias gladius]